MADAPEPTRRNGEERGAETAEAGPRSVSTPVSVVLRKSRGATRWAPWVWRAIGVLPEPAAAPWRALREDADGLDVQVAAPPLELHRTDVDSYHYALAAKPPSLWVVATRADAPEEGAAELVVRLVTASPYEAEAYLESGDEIVDQVPAPAALAAWIDGFVASHPQAEPFKKRRRGAKREDEEAGGLGDPRIRQMSDVYRAPSDRRPRAPGGQGDDHE